MSAENSVKEVLYSDNLVIITRDAITLHNYYFFGWGRTVPVEKIEEVVVKNASLTNGQWRIWGSTNLNTWFPLDIKRPQRDKIFYIRSKNKLTQTGFTVVNSALAENALRQMGLIKF